MYKRMIIMAILVVMVLSLSVAVAHFESSAAVSGDPIEMCGGGWAWSGG
jgi:hypothetical protein